MRLLCVTAYGVPKPAGSKRAFVHKHTKAVVVTESSGAAGKDWRQTVASAAVAAMSDSGWSVLHGPVSVLACFNMPRPKAHFRTGKHAGTLKSSAPEHCPKRPDLTKLWRGVEDALTGIVWHDDSQVVAQSLHKNYVPADGQPGIVLYVTDRSSSQ